MRLRQTVLSACFLLAGATAVTASPITLHFTGTIGVAGSTSGVSVGDSIDGYATYDFATAGAATPLSANGTDYVLTTLDITATVGGTTFSLSNPSTAAVPFNGRQLEVSNDTTVVQPTVPAGTYDTFSIHSQQFSPTILGLILTFYDADHNLVGTNPSWPASGILPLSSFEYVTFGLGGFGTTTAFGSISNVTPVPEPSSLVLLLSGLGGARVFRRYRTAWRS